MNAISMLLYEMRFTVNKRKTIELLVNYEPSLRFDQLEVEAYKKNMFALLGKPGFEREKEELEKRLSK